MDQFRAEGYRLTHRTLRWVMVVLILMLLVATTWPAVVSLQSETSISAYYGTPARDVFVGVLFALAAGLVSYRGATPVEDFALNAAGFYAVFVAVVPTNLSEILADLPNQSGTAVDEYVLSLRLTVVLLVVACLVLGWFELARFRRRPDLWDSGPRSKTFVVVSGVLLGGFLALALWQLFSPATPSAVSMSGIQAGALSLRIHDLAAILLISSLAAAVWSQAFPESTPEWADPGLRRNKPASDRLVRIYRLVFWLMTVGAAALAALVVALFESEHAIILIEWWVIFLFMGFWISETRRTDSEPSPSAAGEYAGLSPAASAAVGIVRSGPLPGQEAEAVGPTTRARDLADDIPVTVKKEKTYPAESGAVYTGLLLESQEPDSNVPSLRAIVVDDHNRVVADNPVQSEDVALREEIKKHIAELPQASSSVTTPEATS